MGINDPKALGKCVHCGINHRNRTWGDDAIDGRNYENICGQCELIVNALKNWVDTINTTTFPNTGRANRRLTIQKFTIEKTD